MSAPHDPLDELAIPDGTTVEEHDLVTDGDVLIGSNSTVDFGVRGRTVAAGERVHFGRQIEADGDCRLDIWCRTEGSVLAGEDAYIGERTHIGGKLLVSGDLDIGDDVTIEEGFDANGWIVTRNPVPVLVFYFIVLSQFLRLGESDKANEFASALAGDGIEERAPLVIPRGAEISDDAWRVSTPARIGNDCRLHGNIRAASITVGTDTTVFGSLRAREDIAIDTGTVIIGDVTTRGGTVTLQAGAHVRGDVSCGDLVVHEGAEVDGRLRARGEMRLIRTSASSESETANTDDAPDEESSDSATHERTADGDVSEAPGEDTSDSTDDTSRSVDDDASESVADASRSTDDGTPESAGDDASQSAGDDASQSTESDATKAATDDAPGPADDGSEIIDAQPSESRSEGGSEPTRNSSESTPQ